jgi:hypothetical protein
MWLHVVSCSFDRAAPERIWFHFRTDPVFINFLLPSLSLQKLKEMSAQREVIDLTTSDCEDEAKPAAECETETEVEDEAKPAAECETETEVEDEAKPAAECETETEVEDEAKPAAECATREEEKKKKKVVVVVEKKVTGKKRPRDDDHPRVTKKQRLALRKKWAAAARAVGDEPSLLDADTEDDKDLPIAPATENYTYNLHVPGNHGGICKIGWRNGNKFIVRAQTFLKSCYMPHLARILAMRPVNEIELWIHSACVNPSTSILELSDLLAKHPPVGGSITFFNLRGVYYPAGLRRSKFDRYVAAWTTFFTTVMSQYKGLYLEDCGVEYNGVLYRAIQNTLDESSKTRVCTAIACDRCIGLTQKVIENWEDVEYLSMSVMNLKR